MDSLYIKMIKASIRTALRMHLNYYEFNWYLLGTKNGYRYTNELPSSQEIVYADKLIDKVAISLLMKGRCLNGKCITKQHRADNLL